MNLPVAILAGGLGTRLGPLTEEFPKALIEVAGEPFAAHQLRLLARNSIQTVVFCLGHLGEQIVETVGDGSRFGIRIRYVFDGPKLLGTAGAIARALPELGEQFFILYGDSYLDCDYRSVAEAYSSSGKPALMTVFANEGRWDTSNVEFDGQRIVRYNKTTRNARMQHIDYGLGVAHRSVFNGVSTQFATDLAVVYEGLAAQGKLAALEVLHRFYEVGSVAGIRALERYLGDSQRHGLRQDPPG